MSDELNLQQLNNLLVGTRLAAEVRPSSGDRRAFLVVGAYQGDPTIAQTVSKFLNADHSKDRFWLRVFELEIKRIGQPDAEHFEQELAYLDGIESVEALEHELSMYLEDLSVLDVYWKLDYKV